MRTSLQAAIGIIMIFILVGSIGLLLGGMSGDFINDPAGTPTEQVETTTQSATATASTTATAQSTATVMPETESVPVEQSLSSKNIESLIEENINNHPDSVTGLSTGTQTGMKLNILSKNHSRDMSQSATLSHDVGNGDSEARYRSAELYDLCQFQEQQYIVNAQRNRLESIARVDSDEYRGETTEITEENIADVIVADWFNSITYRDRLRYENANHLGVGIDISEDGQVYATAAVC